MRSRPHRNRFGARHEDLGTIPADPRVRPTPHSGLSPSKVCGLDEDGTPPVRAQRRREIDGRADPRRKRPCREDRLGLRPRYRRADDGHDVAHRAEARLIHSGVSVVPHILARDRGVGADVRGVGGNLYAVEPQLSSRRSSLAIEDTVPAPVIHDDARFQGGEVRRRAHEADDLPRVRARSALDPEVRLPVEARAILPVEVAVLSRRAEPIGAEPH